MSADALLQYASTRYNNMQEVSMMDDGCFIVIRCKFRNKFSLGKILAKLFWFANIGRGQSIRLIFLTLISRK